MRDVMRKSIITYELLNEFYSKKKELEKLDLEIREIRNSIVSELKSDGLLGGRVGGYTYYIEPCHKPTQEFIDVMKEHGYSKLVRESCSMANFNKVFSDIGLENKRDFLEFWFDKLYVKKK